MWWTLGGVLTPLAIWGLIAATNNNDIPASFVGKVVTLQKTGVAVSKSALVALAVSDSMSTLSALASAGQVLTPAIGTRVRITYTELFREVNVFQVVIQEGRYRGRTGWIIESQIRSLADGPVRRIPYPAPQVDGDTAPSVPESDPQQN